jgi:hypothetical protein
MSKEIKHQNGKSSSMKKLPTKEETEELKEKLALQDNIKGSHQKDTGIQCGREQTCCGKSVPCETRPCDR